MKTTFIYTALFVGALAISSCGGNTTDTKDVAEERNEEKFDENKDMEKDAERIVEAYSSGLLEQHMSRELAPLLYTAEAKSLADMMGSAHEKANEELRALATKKQISLPAGLTPEQADKINDMKKEKGIDLDKKYVSRMVDDHKDEIDRYEKYADKMNDTEARSWFAGKVSELRSHHQMAENAWNSLKDRK